MRREGCAREEVRLPSHPSTIYRGKGRGGGALGFLPRENPRETCPPSQAGGGLPPKSGGGALIHLQRIYNFLLFHAIILSVLDV